MGNIPIDNANDRQQVLRLYDANNNGIFDRDEIPRFLTRNAGGSRPFSLTSSNEYRGENRYRSRVLRWLDLDEDGSLSADEWEQAAVRLRARDANQDELLLASDFRETSNQAVPMLSNRRRVTEPDTALLLSSTTRFDSLLHSLEESYAFGGRIRAEDMPRDAGFFQRVDTNGNGVWDREELSELLAIEPHVVLQAAFGESETGAAPLSLVSLAPHLRASQPVVIVYPRRLVLRLADANVEIFVNDMVGAGSGRAAAAAQFEQLDRDKNGYLDREEYPAENPPLQVPFEGLDLDGDGKVDLAEFETFFEQRQRAIRSQIRARAADQEDALFTALDLDGDGRLNPRETRSAATTLAALDANQDGRLTPSEIPPSFVIALVRGDPQQGNNLFVMPTTPAEPLADAPDWFIHMDANADGMVSDSEFLGTRQQFQQLDADGDGFISTLESAAAP